MNPIKNKKDLETIIDEIRKFAYDYLEKYSPSKQQLKTYLFKKYVQKKEQKFEDNQYHLIRIVLQYKLHQKKYYLMLKK